MLTSSNLTGICIWNGHGRLAFRWTWSISCSTNVLWTKDWDILARITPAMSHETSWLLVHLLTICAIVKDRASLICNLICPLKNLNMENLGQVISISNFEVFTFRISNFKNFYLTTIQVQGIWGIKVFYVTQVYPILNTPLHHRG